MNDGPLDKAEPEELLWTGRPSQLKNVYLYLACLLFAWLIVPIGIASWNWLVVRCHVYMLTNQRLKVTRGVFSRLTEELELFRVKDIVLEEPLHLRVFGLGRITLFTSDKTTPTATIEGIRNAHAVREHIRKNVVVRRDDKRVQEIDVE